eukprot:gene6146-6383_t
MGSRGSGSFGRDWGGSSGPFASPERVLLELRGGSRGLSAAGGAPLSASEGRYGSSLLEPPGWSDSMKDRSTSREREHERERDRERDRLLRQTSSSRDGELLSVGRARERDRGERSEKDRPERDRDKDRGKDKESYRSSSSRSLKSASRKPGASREGTQHRPSWPRDAWEAGGGGEAPRAEGASAVWRPGGAAGFAGGPSAAGAGAGAGGDGAAGWGQRQLSLRSSWELGSGRPGSASTTPTRHRQQPSSAAIWPADAGQADDDMEADQLPLETADHQHPVSPVNSAGAAHVGLGQLPASPASSSQHLLSDDHLYSPPTEEEPDLMEVEGGRGDGHTEQPPASYGSYVAAASADWPDQATAAGQQLSDDTTPAPAPGKAESASRGEVASLAAPARLLKGASRENAEAGPLPAGTQRVVAVDVQMAAGPAGSALLSPVAPGLASQGSLVESPMEPTPKRRRIGFGMGLARLNKTPTAADGALDAACAAADALQQAHPGDPEVLACDEQQPGEDHLQHRNKADISQALQQLEEEVGDLEQQLKHLNATCDGFTNQLASLDQELVQIQGDVSDIAVHGYGYSYAAAAGAPGHWLDHHPWWQLPETGQQATVLQHNRQGAAAARLDLAKLLPDSMQQEAQQQLSIAQPLKKQYDVIQDLTDTWEQLQQQHAEDLSPVQRFLNQRRTLLQMKYLLMVNRYKAGVSSFQEHLKAEQEAAALAAVANPQPQLTTGWSSRQFGAGSGSTRARGGAPGHDRGAAALEAGGFHPYQQAIVKSQYEEQQLMRVFRAVEDLKHMSVLPQQLLDPWQKRWAGFASNNGLVEDPLRELQEDKTGLDWTPEERRIFMEKFLQFPKNFRAIASYLQHRTPAECVVFFYKHQKLDEFANVRRKQQLKKRRQTAETKRVWASGRPLAISALQAAAEQREQRYKDRDRERERLMAAEREPAVLDRGARGADRDWVTADRTGGAAAWGLTPAGLAGGPGGSMAMYAAGSAGGAAGKPSRGTARGKSRGGGKGRGSKPAGGGGAAGQGEEDDDDDADYHPMMDPSQVALGERVGTVAGWYGRRMSSEDGGGGEGAAAAGNWPDELFMEAVRQHGKDYTAVCSFLTAAGYNSSSKYVRWFYGRHKKRLNLDEVAEQGEAAAAHLEQMFSGRQAPGSVEDDAAAGVLDLSAAHGWGSIAAAGPFQQQDGLQQQLQHLGQDDEGGLAAGAPAAAVAGFGVSSRRGTATWTDDERYTFVEQFKLVGKDWGRIAEAIPSKTNVQVRTFYQNNKQRLSLDKLEAAANFPAAPRGRLRGRPSSLAANSGVLAALRGADTAGSVGVSGTTAAAAAAVLPGYPVSNLMSLPLAVAGKMPGAVAGTDAAVAQRVAAAAAAAGSDALSSLAVSSAAVGGPPPQDQLLASALLQLQAAAPVANPGSFLLLGHNPHLPAAAGSRLAAAQAFEPDTSRAAATFIARLANVTAAAADAPASTASNASDLALALGQLMARAADSSAGGSAGHGVAVAGPASVRQAAPGLQAVIDGLAGASTAGGAARSASPAAAPSGGAHALPDHQAPALPVDVDAGGRQGQQGNPGLEAVAAVGAGLAPPASAPGAIASMSAVPPAAQVETNVTQEVLQG